ncbi:thymidylate synthase [Microbacteriaceae bacterium VKM Ac-2854]|nr:thymidylate synthase [Microbacteriaceae bacterium VKM Ac-2854]
MSSEYPDFESAYVDQLRRTVRQPEYENAPRGHASLERLGVSFTVQNSTERAVRLPSRRANIVFCFAESLWYLSGSNDLDFIAYYAPSIAKYSADGRTLQGTAYGPRIFDYHGRDQWDVVVDTLRADPDSKRAVVQIFDAHEVSGDNIDVACTLALQFLLRDGRLCGVGFMRANDVFRGMVSDVFSFTVLLEVLARQIGAEVGSYSHQVGSLHVYGTDARWAGEVLAEADRGAIGYSESFPRMPHGDNRGYIRRVLAWERDLRLNAVALDATQIDGLDLPEYWKDVVRLFELYRRLRHDAGDVYVDDGVCAQLHPVVRDMLLTKWPQLGALAVR